jgi:putative restriction endonuclease
MSISHPNSEILQAAFDKLSAIESMWGDEIPWQVIAEGFDLNGETILMANKARGIFKPKQMARGLISIKTTEPKKGRLKRYDDEEHGDGFYRYALQDGDPKANGNKLLWEAYDDRSPFVYFHAIAPSFYKAIWPCYVMQIHPDKGYCEVIAGPRTTLNFGHSSVVIYALPSAPVRNYAVRESRIRLFQATFRENVLRSYASQCAITKLSLRPLLDAAHITPDADVDSSTEVSNGIALSKLHHRAFDANLIGISPDLIVEVSRKVLEIPNGIFNDAFKKCDGVKLFQPFHMEARADRDRLAKRYEQFKKANR